MKGFRYAFRAAFRTFWRYALCPRGIHNVGEWYPSRMTFGMPDGTQAHALVRTCKCCLKGWTVYPKELADYEQELKTRYTIGGKE